MITNKELIDKAKSVAIEKELSNNCSVGVGSALVTSKNNIFLGVSIHCACAIGFCAEHNAIGSMVTAGESRIKKIVAVGPDGKILPPCGRCRELILQINGKNLNTEIIISKNKVVKLKELLPHPWQKRI